MRFPGLKNDIWDPGGNALIFSLIVSKYGIPVSVAGQIGNDKEGQHLNNILLLNNIDTSHLRLSGIYKTKKIRINVDSFGEWTYFDFNPVDYQYITRHVLECDPNQYSHLQS